MLKIFLTFNLLTIGSFRITLFIFNLVCAIKGYISPETIKRYRFPKKVLISQNIVDGPQCTYTLINIDNHTYMLEILNSSSISFLFSYTIPRAFLMKQYATLKYAKYALIGDANVKDASKCVTFQYVRYSIRNRARSHDFEVFSSCSKVYVLRTRKD